MAADVRIDIATEFTGKKAFKEADTATQKLTKSVKRFAGAAGIAFGTTAILAYSKASVKAYAQDEAAALRLNRAVENLVAADLVSSVGGATSKIRNTTDAADVAVTGLTENSAGNYTATFTAQTSADSMTVKVLKNGYDVVVDTIAIP